MPVARPRKLFVNLGVKDLDASVAFFTRLGFAFDPRLTDENATCIILSDEAFVMLLVEDCFKDFTTNALCDAGTHTEAILAVSADSRSRSTRSSMPHSCTAAGRPASHGSGLRYGRSFHDVDGHLWEVIWMDPGALGEPV